MNRRRDGGDARGALLTEADELENALRLFFRVPSARSRKRTRPDPQAEAPGNDSEVHLKRIKQVLRDAGTETQSALVQRVVDIVMAQLGARKVAPAVLERAITLSGELFRRSAAFRKLVATQASQFYARLLAAAGEDGEATRIHGAAAKRTLAPLRHQRQSPQLSMVLGLIEQWKENFGARYLPLVAGYDVLVARGYEFPRVRETQAAEQERAQQTQAHRDRVRKLKARQRQREMAQFVPEMETLLSEMHQIFEILIPTLDAFQLPEAVASPPPEAPALAAPVPSTARKLSSLDAAAVADEFLREQARGSLRDVPATVTSLVLSDADDDDHEDDDIEWESVVPDEESSANQRGDFIQDDEGDDLEQVGMPHEGMDMNEIVQAYGLGSSSYQLMIEIPTSVCERSAENEVLFRTLADGILRLRKRFLPLVRDWLEHATKPTQQTRTAATSERERDEWRQLQDLQTRLHDVELKWEDLVRESERKRFARITPAVVTVPTDAYEPQLPDGPLERRPRSS